MFSGYAALTIETMREQRIAAQQRQRELDAAEVRRLTATSPSAPSAHAAPAAATPGDSAPARPLALQH